MTSPYKPARVVVSGECVRIVGYLPPIRRSTLTFRPSDRLHYGDRTLSRWFDTAAFVSPVGFAFGDSGRHILTGPRLVQWDFSLFKNIPVKAAGTISSTVSSPRQNQFALKLLF
jgi:hypothetical protein